jgi:hypothetical protein
MPRFVILQHTTPPGYERPLHWDLMLESGDVLRTWALEQEPTNGATINAEQLADHRSAYLEYEGPISGERGSVTRWDQGTYSVESESDNELVVVLEGARLNCRLTLTRQSDNPQRWAVCFGGTT